MDRSQVIDNARIRPGLAIIDCLRLAKPTTKHLLIAGLQVMALLVRADLRASITEKTILKLLILPQTQRLFTVVPTGCKTHYQSRT